MRAQRANARRATGPRTHEGRRRSALNRLAAKPNEIKQVWHGVEPKGYREFLRIWRDLRFLFGFVKRELWWREPRLEIHLKSAAWAWQSKLHALRNGFPTSSFDPAIEGSLGDFLFEYRLLNRKCDCWCRREFGAGGRELCKLREGIEARMSAFHPRQLTQPPGAPESRERRRRTASAGATETPGEHYQPVNTPPAAVTSPDRNQSPITFENLGLGPFFLGLGPEFPRNRNQ